MACIDRIQRGTNTRRFLYWIASRNQRSFGSKHLDFSSMFREDDDATTLDGTVVTIGSKLKASDYADAEYLSIVYYATDGMPGRELETLDLILLNHKDYDVLLNTLRELVERYKMEKQRYTYSTQFLKYHWLNTLHETESDSSITMQDWMKLCDALQVNVKKSVLTNAFHYEANKYSNNRNGDLSSTESIIQFPSVVRLVEELKASVVDLQKDPLHQVWYEMVDKDPFPFVGIDFDDGASLELSIQNKGKQQTVSAVAFRSFLKTHQMQDLTIDEVTDLIHAINRQKAYDDVGKGEVHATNRKGKSRFSFRKKKRESAMSCINTSEIPDTDISAPLDEDRLSKTGFFNYLASDSNDLFDPDMGKVGVDDMTKPLSDYWIHSSHDTYLQTSHKKRKWKKDNNAHSGYVDEQQYTSALLRGVRCLEIDVWESHWSKEPVICRHKPDAMASTTPLSVVLQAVKHFLYHNPQSFPVILKMENHCSTAGQAKVAQQFFDTLGAVQLIVLPDDHSLESNEFLLPSPESARGKVVLIAKRPANLSPPKVLNDDFDDENNNWRPTDTILEDQENEESDESEERFPIVGFNSEGPIRSTNSDAVKKTPAALLEECERSASQTECKLQEAKQLVAKLEEEVKASEAAVASLTEKAGISHEEVRQRADTTAGREYGQVNNYEEEKSPKEEGIEIYEVLPNFVQEEHDRYAKTAQVAMEADEDVREATLQLKDKEELLKEAMHRLDKAQQQEAEAVDAAKRAAAEARSHWEYADVAKQRVAEVKNLLSKSNDKTTSVQTVVVTALTEAKISEKRATEAESRAARAVESAQKDRLRAEEETKKEEMLEQEMALLHSECSRATDQWHEARQNMENCLLKLDKVNEQIRLIESSKQYKKERKGNYDGDSSFVAKLDSKVAERDSCRNLTKKASLEVSKAEDSRVALQKALAEKSRQWKRQVDKASKMRKTADRVAHVTEELAENAEEEREAATLRHFARERAEQAVADRDSQRKSLEAQLAQAERAASEAANMAVKSRKRADRFQRQADIAADHDKYLEAVELCTWERDDANAALASALEKKKDLDAVVKEEKRRMDSAAEVYMTAESAAKAAVDGIKVAQLYEQEAVIAYNKGVMLRQQTDRAIQQRNLTETALKEKWTAVQRARRYREVQDRTIEIPFSLTRLTLLHSSKYRDWSASHSLSQMHVHSIDESVLQKMLACNELHHTLNFKKFTASHLCRIFPSSKMHQQQNTDAVLCWSTGCQLVANSLHLSDEQCLVHDGRFRRNGSCGYVLKPVYLRKTKTLSVATSPDRWNLSIVAGFHLPRQKTSLFKSWVMIRRPFVKVSLHTGEPGSSNAVIHVTKPATQGGLYAVWGDDSESFEFQVTNPDTAILTMSVWDKCADGSVDFIGQAAMPASCLRQGHRSVPLFDSGNARYGALQYASLLVKSLKVKDGKI